MNKIDFYNINFRLGAVFGIGVVWIIPLFLNLISQLFPVIMFVFFVGLVASNYTQINNYIFNLNVLNVLNTLKYYWRRPQFDKMNMKELKKYIRNRKIKIPKNGSGKKGGVVKQDLLELVK